MGRSKSLGLEPFGGGGLYGTSGGGGSGQLVPEGPGGGTARFPLVSSFGADVAAGGKVHSALEEGISGRTHGQATGPRTLVCNFATAMPQLCLAKLTAVGTGACTWYRYLRALCGTHVPSTEPCMLSGIPLPPCGQRKELNSILTVSQGRRQGVATAAGGAGRGGKLGGGKVGQQGQRPGAASGRTSAFLKPRPPVWSARTHRVGVMVVGGCQWMMNRRASAGG